MQREKRIGGVDRPPARLRDDVQKERYPFIPGAVTRDVVQPINILVLSPLEDGAEIKDRLADRPSHKEMKRYQHTPDSAVAVSKRMDRLELVVDERGVDQVGNPEAILALNVFLQLVEGRQRLLPRGRNEARIFDLVGSNEVLMLLELARLRIGASVRSDAAKQRSVSLA